MVYSISRADAGWPGLWLSWAPGLVVFWRQLCHLGALPPFLSTVCRPRIYLLCRSHMHSFSTFSFLTNENSHMIALTLLLNHGVKWYKFGSLFRWNPQCLLKASLYGWRNVPDISWTGDSHKCCVLRKRKLNCVEQKVKEFCQCFLPQALLREWNQ